MASRRDPRDEHHRWWTYRSSDQAGGGLPVTMETLEAVLVARAEALGDTMRRGYAIEALDQSDSRVVVRAAGQTFRSGWVVGCDGGRSTVRKLAGFDFLGTEPEFTGYSAEIELERPDMLEAGRHYTAAGMYTLTGTGTVAMVDFDGGASHRVELITREHVQAVLRRVSGREVVVTALRLATTWTDRAYQTTRYRRGRVLLAGDAAHVHSPLGGQGLNLGLGTR